MIKKRGTVRRSSCRVSKNGLNVSFYTFNPFVYLTFFIDFVKFRRIIIRIGNAIQKIRPNFKGSIVIDGLARAASERIPVIHGPNAQPKSPNIASIANIAVPPFGKAFAERLNIPGHIVEAERPQSPQPIRETSGIGTSEVIR